MNVFSVIVTYNPDLVNLKKLIEKISSKFEFIILVDNFSKNQREIVFDSIEIVKLTKNFGIAAAQNIGIKKAIELGAENILFFDQDSSIDEDFIDNLYKDFISLKHVGHKIAAIGPQFIDKELGFYAPALIVNKNGLIDKVDIKNITEPKEVSIIISSGSLISVTALQDIGLMNEDFFIDYVDTEWCFRALDKGYKIYVSNKATMHHSVGDATIKLFGFTCPVHSAYRRYYRVRNLLLMRNIPHVKKIWILKMLLNNILVQFLLIVTQKSRKEYLRFFIISIYDGIKMKKGFL